MAALEQVPDDRAPCLPAASSDRDLRHVRDPFIRADSAGCGWGRPRVVLGGARRLLPHQGEESERWSRRPLLLAVPGRRAAEFLRTSGVFRNALRRPAWSNVGLPPSGG